MTPTYFYGFSDAVLEVILHEPSVQTVPEALVQDVWQHQRLENAHLQTIGGVPVSVLDPGRPNTDAGPDFLNAKLRLGSTTWTGAVEIHTSSGIWQDHGHDRDPIYNSTLLHVVLYHDIWTGKLRREDGTLLPELVLYPHLEAPLRRLIHSFYTRTEDRILCSSGWHRVPQALLSSYLDELAMERLAAKSRRYRPGPSLESALYEGLFSGLGYSKNTASMRTLARIVPLKEVRSLDHPRDVEAVFFGASGLLPEPGDLLDADRDTADYVIDLRDRFERLNYELEITPMPATAWRFFRLRPANFPTVRIAQAAALLHPPDGILSSNPISKIQSAARSDHAIAEIRSLLAVELDAFWTEHVRLVRRTKKRSTSIGRERIDALIVNVILPALRACHEECDDVYLDILRTLPATQDEVTRQFSDLGAKPTSAAETQAYHQLFRTRCSEARCLTCDVGKALLSDVP